MRVYNWSSWGSVGAQALLGTADNPAPNASSIKAQRGNPEDGPYYYDLGGTVRQLYTDFSTFPDIPMVLVTRLSTADHLHYQTIAYNTEDLVDATDGAPVRSAKISDAEINHIVVQDSIRWLIVAQKGSFYRMNDSWTSNFGSADTCSYTSSHINAYGSPSNTPGWTNAGSNGGACGGWHATDGWMGLSGIHTNDPDYTGGYSGVSSFRVDAPVQYQTSGSDGTWDNPGFVFIQW
jgi:hypothetical protein